MYNSKDMCVDNELTFLSYSQNVNAEFSVDDILSGDLWVVYVNGGVYKCVPLFNCDKLVSSNANDIVVDDNKCLILQYDDDTIVTAVSDDVGSTHYYSLQLYAFTPYTKLDYLNHLYVYVIVYDEFLNTLNNVTVNVYIDNVLTSQVQTNNQGIAKYDITEPCEISFEYNENVSNLIQISGGE